MRFELHEPLRAAKARNALPAVTAYNRIDGPGSSLDLRESHRHFLSAPRCGRTARRIRRQLGSRKLPRTVGITINVGTRVEARPFKPGYIAARSYDFKWSVSGQPGLIPATKQNWLLKIMDLFGLSGVEFALRNTHPGLASSGLGGSATATTAVCLLANELTGRPFRPNQLVALASRMEKGLGVSIPGTQEQSDVVFGGVTDYVWRLRRVIQPASVLGIFNTSIRISSSQPNFIFTTRRTRRVFLCNITRKCASVS
jgi:D-glycero-alpha-D-manno-heptose-7-phosphate kinase